MGVVVLPHHDDDFLIELDILHNEPSQGCLEDLKHCHRNYSGGSKEGIGDGVRRRTLEELLEKGDDRHWIGLETLEGPVPYWTLRTKGYTYG